MGENEGLTARFEESREHLRVVAYRMLGSLSEADDAVQESWLRLDHTDVTSVENLGGWLTTVVARVCLDMLRSRKARREAAVEPEAAPASRPEDARNPETEALMADSVGLALLIVLDTLEPAERTAFVLHDMFDLPFEEIARIVGRSPAAARQLASRARRRVQGASTRSDPGLDRKREVVDAFLAASRNGDFDALLAVLDPDVVLRADDAAVRATSANAARGAPSLASEVRGAHAVAETFKGRARGAQRALIGGSPGAVWAQGGQPRAAFVFAISSGKVVEVDLIMEPARLDELDVEILDD